MNKGSNDVEGKSGDDASSRNESAARQDTVPAARAQEQVAMKRKQQTKARTSARKRRAPFVL